MHALLYNKVIDCWYLLDWSKRDTLDNIIVAPFLVVGQEELGTIPKHNNTGGFRWDETGAIFFSKEYPAKEVKKIKAEYPKCRSPKPVLRVSH